MELSKDILKQGAALAPMAGATDVTMRRLCAQHGAVFTVSEMVSAKALTYKDKKSTLLMRGGGGDVPFGIQLFGAEAEAMAEATKIICEMREKNIGIHFDFVDINMGCPAPKITGGGAGSALLCNLPLAGEIAKSVVQATELPVTVKLRLGWEDTTSAVELAKRCEDAGVYWLVLHGRTRKEMYQPGIHTDAMAAVKAAVNIPVIANGDVTDGASALALMQNTGCDGVAVGRGAMGNPWVFDDIAAAMQGKPAPQPVALEERLRVLRQYLYDMCEDKGEFVAMQQARSHAAWFMHGLRGAAQLRRECCTLRYFAEVDALLELARRLQKEPPEGTENEMG